MGNAKVTQPGLKVVDIDANRNLLLVKGSIPGAPGGLGVRESALVLLMGNAYPADTALAISLLSRLATVAADVVIFVAGALLPRPAKTTGAAL